MVDGFMSLKQLKLRGLCGSGHEARRLILFPASNHPAGLMSGVPLTRHRVRLRKEWTSPFNTATLRNEGTSNRTTHVPRPRWPNTRLGRMPNLSHVRTKSARTRSIRTDPLLTGASGSTTDSLELRDNLPRVPQPCARAANSLQVSDDALKSLFVDRLFPLRGGRAEKAQDNTSR